MAFKKQRRRNNNRAGKICISMIVMAFVVVMSIQIMKVYQKDKEYIAIEEEYREQLEAEQARSVELEEYEKEINSRSSIEDTARSKLGLVYDNEIVFKEDKE